MASLPTELIISILTRLPSKSLFRFKCVSKTWNSLISSPHLIRLHLAHSLSADRRLLILNYGSHLESTPLKWGSELDFGNDFSRFDLPSSFSGFEFSICGCCNGLIALICKNADDPQSFKFILWNPSINSHFILPSIPVDALDGDLSFEFLGVSFGFGYDCEKDDYKIVRIVDYFHHSEDDGITSDFDVDDGGSGSSDGDFDVEIDDEDGSDDDNEEEVDDGADGSDGDSHKCRFGFIYREVMVYSLKENSWKLIHVAFFGDQMEWFCPGAVVNNSIVHWIFWKYVEREPQLRGFDLSSFEWTDELALPNFKGDDDDDTLSKSEFKPSDIVVLGVLDGCLCLVTQIFPGFECENAYVWVMKEYGVEDSWTKLFNVSNNSLMGPLSSSPLGSSKGGDEVLLRKADEDALCCYDLRKNIVKGERKIQSSLKLRDVCVESLVPAPTPAPAPAPAPGVDGSDEGS